jgi:hypothetical protein
MKKSYILKNAIPRLCKVGRQGSLCPGEKLHTQVHLIYVQISRDFTQEDLGIFDSNLEVHGFVFETANLLPTFEEVKISLTFGKVSICEFNHIGRTKYHSCKSESPNFLIP